MHEQLNEKEIADVIGDSREYLDTHGWWKGALIGPNKKQVCAWGAVLYGNGLSERQQNVAYESFYPLSGAVNLIVDQITEIDYCCGRDFRASNLGHLTHWNDEHAKSKQEVLDLFMKAEKVARSGQIIANTQGASDE